MTNSSLNGPGPKNPDFAEFCGADPATLSPQLRLTLWHRYQAGSPGTSPSDRLKRELQIKHGLDEAKWPTQERARLALMQPVSPPKPAPHVSVASLAKANQLELEALERELADTKRKRPGETMGMRHWLDNRGRQLEDRIQGIRRRQQAS